MFLREYLSNNSNKHNFMMENFSMVISEFNDNNISYRKCKDLFLKY